MTIDQNLTPTEEKETSSQPAAENAGAASDSTATADTAANPNPAPDTQAADVPAPGATDAAAPEATVIENEGSTPVSDQPANVPTHVNDSPESGGFTPVVETSANETPAQATQPDQQPVTQPVPEAEKPLETAIAADLATAPAAPAVQGSQVSDMDLFEAAMRDLESGEESGDYKKLSKGDRVEATVIQVEKDRVFVDLGTKSEGIVPLNELTSDAIEHAGEHVKVGDKIRVVVVKPASGEHNAIVSKRLADFDKVWEKVERAFETGEMLHATVVERVKGGLVVDVGVRGFVPATHVGSGKLRNIEKYVGQPLELKVIEIDRDRKKVVLSNREAEERRRNEAKENLFQTVKPGDVLEGTVRRLTDYGAFVDLGGVDGLLHISEMSWMRINHPREVLKEGAKIKVMVLRIDPGAGKVSLGHRQVLPDPWNLIRENYLSNQKLTVKISRLVQSGAFVKLPEGAEAFLPLSEMSNRRLRKPEEAVEEGQEVEVQIIDLRPDERRMVLSMRAIGGGAAGTGMEFRPGGGGFEDDEFKRGLKKGKKGAKGGRRGRDDDDFEDSRRGFATGGATIGERLGMLKGFKFADVEDDEEESTEESAEKSEESTEA
jgi:predicted RNA-binding protein with RPS1 domain